METATARRWNSIGIFNLNHHCQIDLCAESLSLPRHSCTLQTYLLLHIYIRYFIFSRTYALVIWVFTVSWLTQLPIQSGKRYGCSSACSGVLRVIHFLYATVSSSIHYSNSICLRSMISPTARAPTSHRVIHSRALECNILSLRCGMMCPSTFQH